MAEEIWTPWDEVVKSGEDRMLGYPSRTAQHAYRRGVTDTEKRYAKLVAAGRLALAFWNKRRPGFAPGQTVSIIMLEDDYREEAETVFGGLMAALAEVKGAVPT